MQEEAYNHSFARIYDEIMGGVPYGLWYDYIQEILSFYGLKPEKILDLACGTGNMSLLFAREDKKVVGIDGSSEMLTIAREKAQEKGRNILFLNADLREFQLKEKFDLAVSVFDSINYILSVDDLLKVFNNVHQVLKKDGLFVFDMNTLYRLMSIKPGTTVLTGSNYTCSWQDMVDKEKQKWKVKLKIKFDNEKGYYEEIHQETSFPLTYVKKLLIKSGFTRVDIYKSYTFKKASEKDNRVYFVAGHRDYLKNYSLFRLFKKKIKWTFIRILNLRKPSI